MKIIHSVLLNVIEDSEELEDVNVCEHSKIMFDTHDKYPLRLSMFRTLH